MQIDLKLDVNYGTESIVLSIFVLSWCRLANALF